MKLKSSRRSQDGSLLLGILVLVLAVVIIGLAAWVIIKAIFNLPPRKIEPDDVAQWVQSATIELQSNPNARTLSDGTMVLPLGPTNGVALLTVEMTTNWVDWVVLTNVPAEGFDLVPFVQAEPMAHPAAFYRIRTQ